MSDLSIERVETVLLDVPLRRAHRFARVGMDAQPVLLVFLHTAGGITGVGEGVVPGGPWWGGESVETMQLVIERYVAPILTGRSVDDITGIFGDIDDVVAGNLFAKTAVEVALHDAWARCLNVPLHTLLGGLARLELGQGLLDDHRRRFGAQRPGHRDAGAGTHHTFKLKMGAQEPADDVERVRLVAEKLAGTAGVRVDINSRWDRLTALTYLPALAEAGVELVEQPVPGDQVETLAEINHALPIPVMADESLRTPADALRLTALRAADVYSLKTTKSGGLRATRAIAEIAAAAGIPCHAGTSIETGVGTAATLHLACTAPAVTWGSELFGPLLMSQELLTEPLHYQNGELHLPDGPGLGIELDPGALRALTRS